MLMNDVPRLESGGFFLIWECLFIFFIESQAQHEQYWYSCFCKCHKNSIGMKATQLSKKVAYMVHCNHNIDGV